MHGVHHGDIRPGMAELFLGCLDGKLCISEKDGMPMPGQAPWNVGQAKTLRLGLNFLGHDGRVLPWALDSLAGKDPIVRRCIRPLGEILSQPLHIFRGKRDRPITAVKLRRVNAAVIHCFHDPDAFTLKVD